MTFEEFFIKKKIDLALLQRAKPALYEEFRQHYAQMGEKSFDHSKKYWFNRLRKDFLLQTAEMPVPKAVAAPSAAVKPTPDLDMPSENPSAGTPPPEETPKTARPTGFKPRFKAGTTAASKPTEAQSPAEVPEPTDTEKTPAASDEKPIAPTTKPIGFKPRFKAGVTPPAKTVSGDETPAADTQPDTQTDNTESNTKPLGFKPRFKAGVTGTSKPAPEASPEPEKQEPAPEPPIETTPKPLGFKPRFKAGSTVNKKDDAT